MSRPRRVTARITSRISLDCENGRRMVGGMRNSGKLNLRSFLSYPGAQLRLDYIAPKTIPPPLMAGLLDRLEDSESSKCHV
jgi:hypothetical protein